MDTPELPQSIPWDSVRMITFNPTSVTILFRDNDQPQEFHFSSEEQKEVILKKWFEQSAQRLAHRRPSMAPFRALA